MAELHKKYLEVLKTLRQAFDAEETPYFDPQELLAAADNRDDSDLQAWDALVFELDTAINELAFPAIARSGFRSVAQYVDKLEPFSLTASLPSRVILQVGLAEKALRQTHQMHAEYQSLLMQKLDVAAFGYDKKIKRASDLMEQVGKAVNRILCGLYRFLELHFGLAVPNLRKRADETGSGVASFIQSLEFETHLDRILKARPGDPSIHRIETAEESHYAFDEDYTADETRPNAGTFALDALSGTDAASQPEYNRILSETQT